MYYSTRLDTVVAGMPSCRFKRQFKRQSVKAAVPVKMGAVTHIYAPNAVDILVNSAKTQHVTAIRRHKWEVLLQWQEPSGNTWISA